VEQVFNLPCSLDFRQVENLPHDILTGAGCEPESYTRVIDCVSDIALQATAVIDTVSADPEQCEGRSCE
jgi:hypothetical protein